MEQGTRWMEKQEAQSLRAALEDMDIAEEEKIHKDAQDEAAELVWKHRNPNSPFANPEAPYMNPDIKKDYTSRACAVGICAWIYEQQSATFTGCVSVKQEDELG
jgi:phage gp16-like protein